MRNMRSKAAFALACAGIAATLATVATEARGARHLFRDDFRGGIQVGAPGVAPWYYFTVPPIPPFAFVGDDGIATGGRHGLHVEASGRNPVTGDPAFTRTVPQETSAASVPGAVDHVKWLVYSGHLSSSGYPGHDIARGRETVCSVRGFGGRTFGTYGHPFGSAVLNPNDDLRLAAFAVNSIDLESFLVADWFLTNERIYVFYERLPFGRTPTNNYAAFSFAIPVAWHVPGQRHDLQTAWSRDYIRWLIDGREVYRVDRLGFRISRDFMTLDHGGVEEGVRPRQVDCGMGMFTLLDAHQPSGTGLARLSNAPNFYLNPENGSSPERFQDNSSLPVNRLFGQGAALDLCRYEILDRRLRHRPSLDAGSDSAADGADGADGDDGRDGDDGDDEADGDGERAGCEH